MPDAAVLETPPATTPPPAAAHPGAVTIDLGNLGKKPTAPKDVKIETTPPEPDKTPEKATQAEVVAKPAEPAVTPKTNDKEENMANLRKAREAAEAARKTAEEEVTRIKAEWEASKAKAPELPEDVKTRLTKAEQAEKELQEARAAIRQLDLSRDPEFQAKYNVPIAERISTMGTAALAAGISPEDWKRISGEWDRKQMAEWSETMDPLQKVQFTTAWMAAEDLWQKQQAELKNADQSWQARQQQRQAEAENQQKQYFSQNEQLARSVMAEVVKPETLKEYEDLGPKTEALLMQAARHEIPAKDIFQQLVANQVLARVTVKQKSRIDELEAQIAERDKKISEQDTFIANQAAGVPRGDAAGSGSSASGDKTPIWKNIVVKG